MRRESGGWYGIFYTEYTETMPQRPVSHSFPLRLRWNSTNASGAAAEEQGSPSQELARSASTTTPETPTSGPSSKSVKRRSLIVSNRAPSPPSKTVTAAAAVQTRAELRANVRSDWTFPHEADAECTTVSRVEFDTVYADRELELEFNAPSPPPVTSFGIADAGYVPAVALPSSHIDGGDPYRFEDPDAVGSAVHEQRLQWEKTHADELLINPGLRLWQDRRDAWTGAVVIKRSEAGGVVRHAELDDYEGADFSSSHRPMKRRRLATATQHTNSNDSEQDITHNGTTSPQSLPSSSRSRASSSSATAWTTLVPRPPPLIPPDHPIRSQITPLAYRSIYTRIVAQGTTPTIPVNLSHIISACVAGWKADGEWPPRSTQAPAPNTAAGRSANRRSGTSGVAAAAAMLGNGTRAAAKELRDMANGGASGLGAAAKRNRRRMSTFIAQARNGDRGGGKSGDNLAIDQLAGLASPTSDVAVKDLGAGTAGRPPSQQEAVLSGSGAVAEQGRDGAANAPGNSMVEESAAAPETEGARRSIVGRGVRRVSRAIRTVKTAMMENESGLGPDGAGDGEVHGLVQGELVGTFDQGEQEEGEPGQGVPPAATPAVHG